MCHPFMYIVVIIKISNYLLFKFVHQVHSIFSIKRTFHSSSSLFITFFNSQYTFSDNDDEISKELDKLKKNPGKVSATDAKSSRSTQRSTSETENDRKNKRKEKNSDKKAVS